MLANGSEKNSTPILEGIKQQVIAIETDSSGMNFFEETGLWFWDNAPNINRDNFTWSNKGKEDPANIYILLLGDSHNKEAYEKGHLEWRHTLMHAQLGLVGNSGGKVAGPAYFAKMHHVGEFDFSEGDKWQFNSAKAYDPDARKEIKGFLDDSVQRLKKENDLDEDKKYTAYCMKIELEYVAPSGAHLKGLRPFGKVIGGKYNLPLSITTLRQVGIDDKNGNYDQGNDLAISIPSLSGDSSRTENFYSGKMPWLIEQESGNSHVDKGLAEEWKKYSENKRKKWLKHWIEKQPQAVSNVKSLEKSLDNPT